MSASPSDEPAGRADRWLTRPVASIGLASLLADVGYEVPTALLPGFLTSTLGAPAAALGFIEGVADGGAGVARLVGGAIADEPERRVPTAVGGYTTTAVLSGLIGVATAAWQVGVLRTGAWVARGIRGPSRNAILADAAPAATYGRAYGFERAMDNLGAILGPLLALALVALTSVRTAMLVAVVPGVMAAAAMLYAARFVTTPRPRERARLRIRVRPVLRGRLGRLMLAIGAFEFGNIAATLLILRATELLTPSRGRDGATELALVLYLAYNVAATLTSVPAGHVGDRRGSTRALALGVGVFLVAYAGFAVVGAAIGILAVLFVLAGVGIGFVETAEAAAVATHAHEEIRGSAFGLLAATQSLGNLMASGIAGLLWTLVSPGAAFAWAAAWMALSLGLLTVEVLHEHRRSG